MAGTATVTSMSNPEARDGDNVVVIDWTSTSGGAVSVSLCSTYAAARLTTYGYATPQPSKFVGKLIKVVTSPGADGDLSTDTPTDGYDLTLLDAYGNDIAGGYCKDRSASLAEQYVPAQPVAVDSEITFTIANAGDSNKGRVILHFQKG